jgi:hypothetical protein
MKEFSVFLNIMANLMTVVCICWLILQKFNYSARNRKCKIPRLCLTQNAPNNYESFGHNN